MILRPIQGVPDAAEILYRLLRERSAEGSVNISHRAMPSWEEHLAFIDSTPFRAWYLIEVEGQIVGYVSATFQNEIGIVLFQKYRSSGYGARAVKMLMEKHAPLPAIPSKRAAEWLANINPANERSVRMFCGLGFRVRQVTYAST